MAPLIEEEWPCNKCWCWDYDAMAIGVEEAPLLETSDEDWPCARCGDPLSAHVGGTDGPT